MLCNCDLACLCGSCVQNSQQLNTRGLSERVRTCCRDGAARRATWRRRLLARCMLQRACSARHCVASLSQARRTPQPQACTLCTSAKPSPPRVAPTSPCSHARMSQAMLAWEDASAGSGSQYLGVAGPPPAALPPPPPPPPSAGGDDFTWTAGKVGLGGATAAYCGTLWAHEAHALAGTSPPLQVVLSLVLFLAAGVAEIGGGWLVWQSIRLHKGWYLAVAGAMVLFCYGLIPCAQPVDNFGRVRRQACGGAGGAAALVLPPPWQRAGQAPGGAASEPRRCLPALPPPLPPAGVRSVW